MGLFQSRPEEPQDWGGLPAEPYNPEFDAARLDNAGAISSALLEGGPLGGTESVTISFSMDALAAVATEPAGAEPAAGDTTEPAAGEELN